MNGSARRTTLSLMTTLSPYDSMSPVTEAAYRAKAAGATLAPLPRAEKDDALLAIADALEVRASEIVEANAKDVAKAREAGTSEGMIDRLTLTPERIRAIASDVRDVAALPDPVGEVVRGSTLPNGIDLRQVRVPLGVVGIIYEGSCASCATPSAGPGCPPTPSSSSPARAATACAS